MRNLRYIVVEGPIGVGKTTLVTRLAEAFGGRTVLEQFEENPFLPLFYEDAERYAFQTETFFMLSRFRQQEALVQQDLFAKISIGDYIFGKTRLFASLTLNDDEFRLYDSIFQTLNARITHPDLVIYLTAPLDVLLNRIKRRGRSMEANMDPAYLQSLSQAYARHFSVHKTSPVLVVDSTSFNFADDSGALDHLLEAIERMDSPLAHLTAPGQLSAETDLWSRYAADGQVVSPSSTKASDPE